MKLIERERALADALNKITNFIAYESFYRTGSTTSRTFLWDTFNDAKEEDREKAGALKKKMDGLGNTLFDAYKDYKAYGDKVFAKRIAS